MDNILLCSNHIPMVTSIHNTFIEKHMLGANGSYVKVYLYLSKCIQAGEDDLSISSLADKMENTEKDIIRALNYWEKQGLLLISHSEDKSQIVGIDVLNPDTIGCVNQASDPTSTTTAVTSQKSTSRKVASSTVTTSDSQAQSTLNNFADTDPAVNHTNTDSAQTSEPEMIAVVDIQPKRSASKQHTFTVNAEQAKKLAGDVEFTFTSNTVQAFLQRPLKPNEVQLISYLYDNLHFSSDLILHLYEYCISINKTNTQYIQAVAISWDEKGVKTPAQAVEASADFKSSYNAVSKAFALGRGLAVVEKQYIERWQGSWSIDLSVILEACNRTMLKIQKADFKYCDGILDNWHKAGIHTLQDVEEADRIYQERKTAKREAFKRAEARESDLKNRKKAANVPYNSGTQTQSDLQDLEKKLLKMN